MLAQWVSQTTVCGVEEVVGCAGAGVVQRWVSFGWWWLLVNLEEFQQSQPPSSPQKARLVGASRILQARRCIAQKKIKRGRKMKGGERTSRMGWEGDAQLCLVAKDRTYTHTHTQVRDGVARWRRVCVLFVATVCHGAASAFEYCSFFSVSFFRCRGQFFVFVSLPFFVVLVVVIFSLAICGLVGVLIFNDWLAGRLPKGSARTVPKKEHRNQFR